MAERKKNPCVRDCPRRSMTCHGMCKEYADWKAWNDEQRRALQREAELDRPEKERGARMKDWRLRQQRHRKSSHTKRK